MKRSILIRLSALAVLLLYVAASVGIDVHNCDCTGHVCAHIALYFDNIHDNHHDCHHCCGHEEERGHDSNHHSCCHNKVYRVAIAGDNEDGGAQHLDAPSVQIPAYFCGINVFMPDCIFCSMHVPDSPPPVCSHSGSIFILRV